MSEHERFRGLLKNTVHEENRDEIVEKLLDLGKDVSEKREIINSLELNISDNQKNFLENYAQNLESMDEWAVKVNPARRQRYKRNVFDMLKSETNTLRREIKEAVDEEIELENIAVQLEDRKLAEEAEMGLDELRAIKNRLTGLMEKEEHINEFLKKIDILENKVGGLENINTSIENRMQTIKLIEEHADVGDIRESGPVRVHIPAEYIGKIHEKTQYQEEITGIMICRRKGRDWTALKVFLTGVGTEGSVSPDTDRIQACNELTDEHGGKYALVEFHTHSAGTIDRHGDYYAENWSDLDLENFEEQDDGYVGMLFTPEAILINGKNIETEYQEISKNRQVEEWENTLESDFSGIKSNYSFSNLPDLTPFNGEED